MTVVSQFDSGPICASSARSDNVRSLLAESFDAVVLVPSWDARCTVMAGAGDLHASTTILVLFEETDELGFRDKHAELLQAYANSRGGELVIVRDSVAHVKAVWQAVRNALVRCYLSQGRSLRVMMDASTSPRYITLALMSEGIKSGIIRSIAMTYAEGHYPEGAEGQEIEITQGQWRTMPIPGLIGSPIPSARRYFLVSVGFEGWKTLRVIHREDPDRVSVLFPNPGTVRGYEERTRHDNAALLAEFLIPPQQVIDAHAADAIQAWQRLSGAQLERPNDENVFYLCSGSKPHSIALALRAIELETPTVLYNAPETYAVLRTEPTGIMWRYDVTSKTTPH